MKVKLDEIAAHKGNIIRSEINKQSDYDLEEWIQQRMHIQSGDRILDVGCGSGKQIKHFAGLVGGGGHITGVDIFDHVPGLLKKAEENLKDCSNFTLIHHDANFPFTFDDYSFDIITSCYSVYYIEDTEQLLKEFYRLTRKGGKCFIVGPSWDNSMEFYELHKKVTNQDISENFLSHLWRINNDIIPKAYEIFDAVELSPFVNRVYFTGTEGLKAIENYYRASLLFEEAVGSVEEKDKYISDMLKIIKEEVDLNGDYKITKRAIGLTLRKDR